MIENIMIRNLIEDTDKVQRFNNRGSVLIRDLDIKTITRNKINLSFITNENANLVLMCTRMGWNFQGIQAS